MKTFVNQIPVLLVYQLRSHELTESVFATEAIRYTPQDYCDGESLATCGKFDALWNQTSLCVWRQRLKKDTFIIWPTGPH